MTCCDCILIAVIIQAGDTALHWACFTGRVEVVNQLLNNGANISATSDVSTLISTNRNIHDVMYKLLLKNVNNDDGNAYLRQLGNLKFKIEKLFKN